MTPQEIVAYKTKWMINNQPVFVDIHSDLRRAAKQWCKQLAKHEWHFSKNTSVYQDTFFFENANVAAQFEHDFAKWVIR